MSNNEIEAMLSALLYPHPQTLLLFPCTEPRAPTLPNFTHIPIFHITQFRISNAKDTHIHTHIHTPTHIPIPNTNAAPARLAPWAPILVPSLQINMSKGFQHHRHRSHFLSCLYSSPMAWVPKPDTLPYLTNYSACKLNTN